jgi:hypothetical protein
MFKKAQKYEKRNGKIETMNFGHIPFTQSPYTSAPIAANIAYNTVYNPNWPHIPGPGNFSSFQSSSFGNFHGVNEVVVAGTGATGEFQNMYLQQSYSPQIFHSNNQRQPTQVCSDEKARTKVLRDSRRDPASFPECSIYQ